MSFIAGQEKMLRKTLDCWRKMWKRLRIYNSAYGIYMNQNDTIYNESSKQSQNPLKNFYVKFSRYYCPNLLSRPLLSCRMIEPWHVSRRRYE